MIDIEFGLKTIFAVPWCKWCKFIPPTHWLFAYIVIIPGTDAHSCLALIQVALALYTAQQTIYVYIVCALSGFVVARHWLILPISFKVTSMVLGKSCPSASEATLKNKDECIIFIHTNWVYNYNKKTTRYKHAHISCHILYACNKYLFTNQ